MCNFNIKDLSKVQENSTECLIASDFNLHVDYYCENELNSMYRYGDGDTKNANEIT